MSFVGLEPTSLHLYYSVKGLHSSSIVLAFMKFCHMVSTPVQSPLSHTHTHTPHTPTIKKKKKIPHARDMDLTRLLPFIVLIPLATD